MSAQYAWKGIQHNAVTEGFIDAVSMEDAKTKLRDLRVIITELTAPAAQKKKRGAKAVATPGENAAPKERTGYSPRKIKNRDLMIFSKKFGTMVEAGLPMLKTMKMLEEQSDNPHMRFLIKTIRTDVESGITLSDAFSKHSKVFDTVYINLLRAGETSGKLTFFLKRLTVQLEKSEKIRSRVKGAMMYPLILLIVAMSVITIMLIKVVPVFQNMFKSMGHGLPAITQVIVNASEFLRDPMRGGVLAIAIIVGFILLRRTIRSNYKVRRKFHALLLKIPVVREIVMKSILAKIAMIEGNLSAAGVSVLASLDIIAQAVTHLLYQEALADIRRGVEEGNPLSKLYEKYPHLFPATFSQMIAVGEETGNMDEMFSSVARYYEEEFDSVVDRLTEMMEPIMIVFMGGTIGFLIVAMYMPIFQIGDAVM